MLIPIPALAAVVQVAVPPSPAPAPLTATGSWTVQAEPGSCVLARSFGTTVIGFRPVFDTDEIELFLIAPDRLTAADVGDLRFDLGAGAQNAPYWITQVGDARPILRAIVPRATLAAIAPGTWTVAAPGRTVAFRVTGTAPALTALKDCQAGLYDGLGLPVSLAARRTPTAIANSIAQYFEANAYPQLARDRGEQELVRSELLIDRQGRVADCRTTETNSAILAQQTCAILRQQARFLPARDEADRPVTSTYKLSVRWTLPG